jgi:MarR family 2-MHQ and catechol resistance regulon transcriptional repressor
MEDQKLIDDERITTFGRLVEAHEKLSHLLGSELERTLGLPLVWYGVLIHLGRSGGYRPMGELVNATAFTSGGVTRLVDRMEVAGYLERRPCPTDRRVQHVGLTEAGRDMLRRATEVHVGGIQKYIYDVLDADEIAQWNLILGKVVDSCKGKRGLDPHLPCFGNDAREGFGPTSV